MVAAATLAVLLLKALHWFADHAGTLAADQTIRHDAYLSGLTATILVVVILVAVVLALVGRTDLDHVD